MWRVWAARSVREAEGVDMGWLERWAEALGEEPCLPSWSLDPFEIQRS